MSKLIQFFSALDWLVGSFSLALGLYSGNAWLIAGGAIGLVAAYFKPAVRIQAYLEKKFIRKKKPGEDSEVAMAEDRFYREMLGDGDEPLALADAAAPARARTFADAPVPYGPLYISQNKHNRLSRSHIGISTLHNANRYY